MQNKTTDYLIVGGGICGSLLGYQLLKKGYSIRIIDREPEFTSSNVAAGLLNPISFKRKNLSWESAHIFPELPSFYGNLEKELGCRFFHKKDIFHVFSTVSELNDWSLVDPASTLNREFLVNGRESISDSGIINPYGGIQISGSGYIDAKVFLTGLRNFFVKKNVWTSDTFEHEGLESSNDGWTYKKINYGNVIFCEGFKGVQNPYFGHIPFTNCKGEVLSLRIPGLSEEFILDKGMFVIPVGNQIFKAGSTYEIGGDDLASETGKNEILSKLKGIVALPAEVVAHEAGIRPTILDRRPVLGKHPTVENMFIFNGFGSKAYSLVPYFASLMSDFLIGEAELPRDANVIRFNKRL